MAEQFKEISKKINSENSAFYLKYFEFICFFFSEFIEQPPRLCG